MTDAFSSNAAVPGTRWPGAEKFAQSVPQHLKPADNEGKTLALIAYMSPDFSKFVRIPIGSVLRPLFSIGSRSNIFVLESCSAWLSIAKNLFKAYRAFPHSFCRFLNNYTVCSLMVYAHISNILV